MPTILDSLFHKVINTTNSPIGVGGGGEPQSGGTFQYKSFLWGQMASIAWPEKLEPFTDHLSIHGRQTDL